MKGLEMLTTNSWSNMLDNLSFVWAKSIEVKTVVIVIFNIHHLKVWRDEKTTILNLVQKFVKNSTETQILWKGTIGYTFSKFFVICSGNVFYEHEMVNW